MELYDDMPYAGLGYEYIIGIPYITNPPFAFTNYDAASVGAVNSRVTLYAGATVIQTINLSSSYINYTWAGAEDQNITISFSQGRLWTALSSIAITSPTTITAIRVSMMQTCDPAPANFEAIYQTVAESTRYTPGYNVYFYSKLALYADYFAPGYVPKPADPVAPTGYNFIGWKTITGEIYDFDSMAVDSTWLLQDGDGYDYLNLYAVFVNIYDPGIEYDPTVTENAPAGLVAILTDFGLYNEAGKFLIFFVLVLIIDGVMLVIAAFRTNPIIIVIVDGALAIFFMFLGWLAPWISIAIILFLVTIVMYQSKRENAGGTM